MRLTLKSEWLPLILVAASWVMLASFWPRLPEMVPTHWGVNGEVNQWTPRVPGAFIGPVMASVLYVLLTLMPWIDPRKQHYEAFGRVYQLLKTALVAFFLLLTYLTLSAAITPSKHLELSALFVGIGLMFLVIGNYLPKVRSNWFVGIRTPWTLSSEEVWYRTHRFGGKVMLVAGLLFILAAWLPQAWQIGVAIPAAVLMGALPILYSYVVFKRLVTR